MTLPQILLNLSQYVTSTLGLALITAALGVCLAGAVLHAMSWRHCGQSAIAGGLLIALASIVTAIYG